MPIFAHSQIEQRFNKYHISHIVIEEPLFNVAQFLRPIPQSLDCRS